MAESLEARKLRRKNLREQARRLPRSPGIYLWTSPEGEVVYVGKSIDLRSRVQSYFGSAPSTPEKASMIVDASAEIDFFVTDNEADALILEHRMIHRHKPRFNVVFRDDKSYPMLKITHEEFPRILVTRKKEKDGGTYLGPYPSAGAVRRTLKLLTSLFPIRDCHFPSKTLKKARLCLSYHIKRCAGPCQDKIEADEYLGLARQAARFLRGDTDEVLADLEAAMHRASENLEFERAALYRDRLQALRKLAAPRRVEPHGAPFDEDVIALARKGARNCIQEIHYRKGRLEGQRRELIRSDDPPETLLLSYLANRYLHEGARLPGALILSHAPEELETFEDALHSLAGRKLEVVTPSRGRRFELVQMALRNGFSFLESRRGKGTGRAGMERLQEVLELPQLPERIEGFDISNTGDTEKVASMVVALDGHTASSEYRRFVIRDVEGIDDFACMKEAVGRRYRRLLKEGAPLPDLILIDGGIGQVGAAREALEDLDLSDLPLVGLAKREERLHRPGDNEGILLPPTDEGRRLLQVLRNEAHRFALSLHRKRRKKKSFRSELDSIRGVGPASKKAILRSFQDLEAVRRASLEELLAVEGLGRGAARAVFEYYRSREASQTPGVRAP